MFIHPNPTEFASSREASLCVRSLFTASLYMGGRDRPPGCSLSSIHLSNEPANNRVRWLRSRKHLTHESLRRASAQAIACQNGIGQQHGARRAARVDPDLTIHSLRDTATSTDLNSRARGGGGLCSVVPRRSRMGYVHQGASRRDNHWREVHDTGRGSP